MKKKIVCILLAVALILALIPVASLAGDGTSGSLPPAPTQEAGAIQSGGPNEMIQPEETADATQTPQPSQPEASTPADDTQEAQAGTVTGNIGRVFHQSQGYDFSSAQSMDEVPFLEVKSDIALEANRSFAVVLQDAEWSFQESSQNQLGDFKEDIFLSADGSYALQVVSPARATIRIQAEHMTELRIPLIVTATGTASSAKLQDIDTGFRTQEEALLFNEATPMETPDSSPTPEQTEEKIPAPQNALFAMEPNAAVQAAPADIRTYFPGGNGSIVSNMLLSFQDSLGNAITNPTISSSIGFQFDLGIPQEVTTQIQNGDYYEITLPDMVSVPYAINNVALYDNSASPVQYGSFSVGTNNVVRITFTSAAQSSSGLTGSLFFKAKFSTSAGLAPGVQTLVLSGENGLSAQFTLKPQVSSPLKMSGVVHGDNLIWTVTMNTGLDTLTNAQLTQRWPSSLVYDAGTEPVQVYGVDVDVYGNPVVGSAALVNPADGIYSADGNGNVSFQNPVSTAYQLVYTTTVDPSFVPGIGGKLDFVNVATLSASELSTSVSVQITVSKTFYSLVELSNTAGYLAPAPPDAPQVIPFTATFGWLLRYNYQQEEIAAPMVEVVYDPTPTDGNPLALNAGSVAVYPVSMVDDTPVRADTPLGASDYELVDDQDGTFTITFKNPINSAYDIVYQTYAADIVKQNFNKSTTASAADDSGVPITSTNTTYVWQQVIGKWITNVNLQDSILSWAIDVNTNDYTMNDLEVTDVLSGEHVYIGGSLEVWNTDENRKLTEGTDYTFDYNTTTNTLTLDFVNDYNPTARTLQITYRTDYSASTTSTVFAGTADATWNGTNTTRAYAEYDATIIERENGAKYGSYNAVTGEITWVVLVNYANTGLKNASISDPIVNPAGTNPDAWQYFVPHSTRVYNYTIDQTHGNPDYAYALRGGEINYGEVTIAEPAAGDASPTLNVQFISNQPPPVKYWVEYKTKLNVPDGNGNYSILGQYTNAATFRNDYSTTEEFDATVNIKHGGKAIEMSGNQGTDGYAHWSILVNPSQSALTALQVTSTPSANQTIQTDTLAVYPGLVDENGNITPDVQHPLAAGRDYSFDYAPTGTNGTMQLVANLYPVGSSDTYTSPKVYIVNYNASIAMAPGETVSNTAQVSSGISAALVSTASKTIPITVTNAGGILVGSRVSFSIKKTDDAGAAMAGIPFQLFDKNRNQVGSTYTTDANGVITFNNAVQGNYYLKELSTLPGYAISDALYNGTYPVSVTATTGQVLVTNSKSRITIPVRGNGQALAAGLEAKYNLYAGTGVSATLNQSGIVSDASSNLVLTGLDPGNYELRQVAAPSGFILNTQPTQFEVVMAGGTQVLAAAVTLDSYQGTFSFVKTDSRPVTLPLPGATFTLINNAGTPELSATAVSAGDGTVTFDHLPPGQYNATETQAAPGWPAVGYSGTVSVTIPTQAAGQTGIAMTGAPVVNDLSNGSVDITVTDALGQPLAGAAFTIYDNGGNAVRTGVTTNAGGIAIATGLDEGTYSAVQTQAPDGYLVNPSPLGFTLALGDMDNDPIDGGTLVDYQASAVLQKEDEDGNALAGAVFTLTNSDTGAVVGDAYETDAGGTLRLSALNAGNYILMENKAPDGFVLDQTPFAFAISQTATSQPAELQLNNGQPFVNDKATAGFVKTDEQGNPLAGVAFSLTRTDGGAQPDITEYVSAADGSVTMAGLSTGSYRILETVAADGFIRNTQPKLFTLDGTQKTVSLDPMVNYQGKVRLLQTDGLGNPLKGAVFELLPKTRTFFTLFLGNYGTYTTDRNGIIEVGGLAPGEYMFKQTAAPQGFLPADGMETLPFTIVSEAAGEPGAVEMEASAKRWGGTLDLLKTDESGNKLGSARFQLVDAAGAMVRADLETADGGTAVVSGLDPGTYRLIEVEAPQGYVLDETPHTVSVQYEPGDAQQEQDNAKITVVNRKMPTPTPSPTPTTTLTPTLPPEENTGGAAGENGGTAVATTGGKTGDNTNLLGYLVLLAASAGVVVVLMWWKVKKQAKR